MLETVSSRWVSAISSCRFTVSILVIMQLQLLTFSMLVSKVVSIVVLGVVAGMRVWPGGRVQR